MRGAATSPDVLIAHVARALCSRLSRLALRDGEVVAIWPLSRQKRSGIWHLRSLDDPFGQFSGMLVRSMLQRPRACRGDAGALCASQALSRCVALRPRVCRVRRLRRRLLAHGATVRGEVGAPSCDTRAWPSIRRAQNQPQQKDHEEPAQFDEPVGEGWRTRASRRRSAITRSLTIIEATLRRRSAWLDDKGLTAPQFRSAAHDEILSGGEAWQL